MGEALELDSSTLATVTAKAIAAFKAADAARRARELVRRKSVLTRSTLPGKLADCTSTDRAQSEIFIVEGDSAGAQNTSTNAILSSNALPTFKASALLWDCIGQGMQWFSRCSPVEQ